MYIGDAGIRLTASENFRGIVLSQGLQAPSPVNHSPNDQIWRDEELARAVQVSNVGQS